MFSPAEDLRLCVFGSRGVCDVTYKETFQLIIIILTVSVAFLLFNISSNLIKSEDENRYASIELHLEERDLPKDSVQERCLIVGVPQDDTKGDIQ